MTLECVAPMTCDGGRQVGRRELEIVSRRSERLRPTQPESRLATRPLQRQVAMLPRRELSFRKSPLLERCSMLLSYSNLGVKNL